MAGRIKSALIDFGGVLGDFNHMIACQRLSAFSGNNYSAEQIYAKTFGNSLEIERQRGEMGGREFFNYCQKNFFLKFRLVSFDVFSVMWGEIFSRHGGMVVVLDKIRRSGLSTYIASNSEELHWPYVLKIVKDLGFDEDHVLPSYSAHARKPEQKYYEQAIELCRCKPEEILYIDDNAEYVQAFRGLGGQGMVYTNKHLWARDFSEKLAEYGVK